MKANPICKPLEDDYIAMFQKIGCEVKLDDDGIHASTTSNNLYILDGVFAFLVEFRVPHHVHIESNVVSIVIRQRYFKED